MRLACIVSLLGFLVGGSALALDLDSTSYTNRKLGVRLEVSEGWQITEQTGYPSMLALVFQPGTTTQIALSVDRLPKAAARPHGRSRNRQVAAAVPDVAKVGVRVAENKKGFASVGLRVFSARLVSRQGRQLWTIAAETKDGKTQVRQRYLKHRDLALIFTLRCKTSELKKQVEELDQIISGLKLL